jgi:hypothetical protein
MITDFFAAVGMFFTGVFVIGVVEEFVTKLRKRFRKPETTDNTTTESPPGCTTVSVTYQIVSEANKEESR